jgi:hypothetical protein
LSEKPSSSVELTLPLAFLEDLIRLPRSEQKHAIKALRLFERNPSHPSLRLKKRESDGLWEISFSKSGRMLFQWVDERTRRRAVFLAVGKHKIVE